MILQQNQSHASVFVQSGSEQVAALFITEISSPFLHARELLKELGYKDTELNLAADVSFPTLQNSICFFILALDHHCIYF